VQIGTPFAFCEESGVNAALKRDVCALARTGQARIHTDPFASPTGFPFKVLQHPKTLSDPTLAAERTRICDLGYLREVYIKADGTPGYRCAGEPIEDYVRKGGNGANTIGRKCLCNGLLATVGLGQRHADHAELPLITAGHDVTNLARFMTDGHDLYRASDVIGAVLADT
jgi:nitronate monooxygenase